jgi:hypothetical protein
MSKKFQMDAAIDSINGAVTPEPKAPEQPAVVAQAEQAQPSNPNPPIEQINQLDRKNDFDLEAELERFREFRLEQEKKAKQKLHEEKLQNDPEYFTEYFFHDLTDFEPEDNATAKNNAKEMIRDAKLTKAQIESFLTNQIDKVRKQRDEARFRAEAEVSHFEKYVRKTYGEVIGETIQKSFQKYMESLGVDPVTIEYMPYQNKVKALDTFYKNAYMKNVGVTQEPRAEEDKVGIDFSSLKAVIDKNKTRQ